MLNKPKFMSPSVNIYGNSVIDLNSDDIPFSCVIDGNEVVTKWQIEVSRLNDNVLVFDTGIQTLSKPFNPIDNRNRSQKFTINIRDYFSSATTYYKEASGLLYDSYITYYNKIDDAYVKYVYNADTWEEDCKSLYYTEFINSSNPYYWNITLWGSSGNIVCSAEESFYANSLPQITIYYSYDNNFTDNNGILKEGNILSNGVSLSKRKIYFKATYTQNENIPLKCYGWRIVDKNNKIILDTISQNQIYGIKEDISCMCRGLINQNDYLIDLYIETQNGQFLTTSEINFTIDYPVRNVDSNFKLYTLPYASGVMIEYGELRTTEGVALGKPLNYIHNYPIYIQGRDNTTSVEVPKNGQIVFEGTANSKNLDIDENSYMVLSFQFDKTEDITLFNAVGEDNNLNPISRVLKYKLENNSLIYTLKKGDILVEDMVELSDTCGARCWYIVILHPLSYDEDGVESIRLSVSENIAEGSLMPSDDLYPSSDTFPTIGEWIRKEQINGV